MNIINTYTPVHAVYNKPEGIQPSVMAVLTQDDINHWAVYTGIACLALDELEDHNCEAYIIASEYIASAGTKKLAI